MEILVEITALPEDLFNDLQEAVDVAEPRLVHQLIVRVREYNPKLADALAELVRQFRFDMLQKAFEEIMA